MVNEQKYYKDSDIKELVKSEMRVRDDIFLNETLIRDTILIFSF